MIRVLPSRPFIPRKANEQVVIARRKLSAAEKISIIIPTLNESRGIVKTLLDIQPLRHHGHEVILVDAGSEDDTVALAQPLVDQLLEAPRGRAQQMNIGARHAWGNTFLFLHADSQLPDEADTWVHSVLQHHEWGFFRVQLASRHPLLRLVGWMMNLRSRLSRIATGDQALFMTRECYEQLGGFADIPLMEDIEISRRLKHNCHGPGIIKAKLITSARRWQQQGIIKTVLLMWRLRWAYWRGEDPAELVKHYYP